MKIRIVLKDEGMVLETDLRNYKEGLKWARYEAQGKLLFKTVDVINAIGYNGIYDDMQIRATLYEKEVVINGEY